MISAPDYNNDDISGFSVLTNLSALAFGNLVVTNSVANTIFFAAITLPIRQNLEKRGTPVYGFNSSNTGWRSVSHSHNAQPSEATATGGHSWPCVS